MSTNYIDTFIAVAPDCSVSASHEPPVTPTPTIARLQYELLVARPYGYTSDELLFAVHAIRHGIPDHDRKGARRRFLAADRACLRASPLAKRYGWGFHHDAEGRIALVGVETPQYARLGQCGDLTQKAALRSSRS